MNFHFVFLSEYKGFRRVLATRFHVYVKHSNSMQQVKNKGSSIAVVREGFHFTLAILPILGTYIKRLE